MAVVCRKCGAEGTVASVDQYIGTCDGEVEVLADGGLEFEPGGYTEIVWDSCEQLGWQCGACYEQVNGVANLWMLVKGGDVMAQIDPGLAVAIAGQVSVGLAGGDGQEERAAAALIAIGLMVRNAAESQLVDDTLALSDTTEVHRLTGGGWRFVVRGVERGKGG
jgi:hypothetical protein